MPTTVWRWRENHQLFSAFRSFEQPQGIDDTYSRMKHQDDEPLGNAFDITWLTVVCIKLKQIKEGKMPRLRIKG